jgi:hypothetical protein
MKRGLDVVRMVYTPLAALKQKTSKLGTFAYLVEWPSFHDIEIRQKPLALSSDKGRVCDRHQAMLLDA